MNIDLVNIQGFWLEAHIHLKDFAIGSYNLHLIFEKKMKSKQTQTNHQYICTSKMQKPDSTPWEYSCTAKWHLAEKKP